jgi:hypothetical protein
VKDFINDVYHFIGYFKNIGAFIFYIIIFYYNIMPGERGSVYGTKDHPPAPFYPTLFPKDREKEGKRIEEMLSFTPLSRIPTLPPQQGSEAAENAKIIAGAVGAELRKRHAGSNAEADAVLAAATEQANAKRKRAATLELSEGRSGPGPPQNLLRKGAVVSRTGAGRVPINTSGNGNSLKRTRTLGGGGKSRGRKSRGRKSRGRKSRGRKSRGRKSRGRKSRGRR